MIEYTTIWQPLTIIFVSFSMGVFFGSLWMFYSMYKSNKTIEEELHIKSEALQKIQNTLKSYTDKYVDDGYEAY